MSTVQARTGSSQPVFNHNHSHDEDTHAGEAGVGRTQNAGANVSANNVNDLGDGAFGQEVKDVQQRLANAGFDPGPIDGDFGPLTGNALAQFQQDRIDRLERRLENEALTPKQEKSVNRMLAQVNDEMSRDVAGNRTQALLERFIMPRGTVLEIGSRGEEVETLQQKLADAGFDPGPVDGIFGPMTDAAVKAFQRDTISQVRDNGFEPTRLQTELGNDVVGAATQMRLERAQAVEPVNTGTGDLDAQIEAIYNEVPADIRRAHPDVREDIGRILEVSQEQGLSQEQTAYVIATATHENNLGFFPEELSSGRQYEGRSDLGNTQPGDGERFKGRGYVQITGRRNYTDWSQRLGVDLVNNPELAADKEIAARILVEGMKDGTFTGRALDRYVNDSQTDFTNARRVVNGTDKASLFAGTAENYNNALASVPSTPVAEAPSAADPSSGGAVRVGEEGDTSADIWRKPTANIANLDPKLTQIFDEVVAAWAAVTDKTPVITSGNDGRHSNGSRHYSDLAIDLRANNITDAQSAELESLLQDALGPEYFVDFEHFPGFTANDHLHISYKGVPA